MQPRRMWIGAIALLVAVGGLAGCSSSGKTAVRSAAESAASSVASRASSAVSSVASQAGSAASSAVSSVLSGATGSATGSSSAHPTITVDPSSNLPALVQVKVTGSGFTPNEALTVIQCADKGTKTGSGDCNLPAMRMTTSDASGAVHAVLNVSKGPFGANNILCTSAQKCLVSVTQASLSPTEEADAPITFQ